MNVWVLLVLVIVVSAAVAVGTILVANRAISASVGPAHNSTLGPFVTTVALVYGTLLGFTVVVAWEQFSSAELNVANEASTLATMYRQTVAMPVQEQQEIRVLLRRYTTAVQGPEWRQQEQHEVSGASDTARSAITEMYRVLGRQDPDAAASAINSEFLGQLTVLASQRNTRVLDAEPRIPWLLWCGLIFGGVLLVGLTRVHAAGQHAGPRPLVRCRSASAGFVAVRRRPPRPSIRISNRDHPRAVRARDRGVRRGRLPMTSSLPR